MAQINLEPTSITVGIPVDNRIFSVYTERISLNCGATMTYARVFQSGNSQAVRLPKEFRFDSEQVEIFRRGDEVILREHPSSALAIFNALSQLPADFMARGREDAHPQERDSF
jgi:antitoxin VapB